MRVSEVSPAWIHIVAVLSGLVFGAVAAYLADLLPRRMGLTHLAEGTRRRRRDAVLVVLTTLCALGLAQRVLGEGDASIGRAAFFMSSNLTLSAMVLAAGAVDVEHMELPNALTLGGALFALSIAQCRTLGIVGSLLGVVVALVSSVGPSFLYRRLRGHAGVGFGDAKLNLLAGAWFGAPGALFVIFAGSLQAAIAAGVMRVFGLSFPVPESVKAELEELRRRAREGDAEAVELLADDPMAVEREAEGQEVSLGAMRLPLGPFLVLACLEFLFFGGAIVSFVDDFLGGAKH